MNRFYSTYLTLNEGLAKLLVFEKNLNYRVNMKVYDFDSELEKARSLRDKHAAGSTKMSQKIMNCITQYQIE